MVISTQIFIFTCSIVMCNHIQWCIIILSIKECNYNFIKYRSLWDPSSLLSYILYPSTSCLDYLHPLSLTLDLFSTRKVPCLDYSVYADKVVHIAAKVDMSILLKSCEDHSYQPHYLWNPSKCVVLVPTQIHLSYTPYGKLIQRQSSFSYLKIPFH